MKTDSFRYVVNISFKQGLYVMSKPVAAIVEPVKTLKDAQAFKTLIDDTVKSACIIDRVTNKVVEWWVK